MIEEGMAKKLRVGILFGGRSGEHAVSLLSAASVLKAIDRKKFDVADVFARYLAALEHVTAAVDRMLDSGPVNPA